MAAGWEGPGQRDDGNVHRGAAPGDAWAFPASLGEVIRPVGVLILHWWAITGNTLLQLIRLAAKSGASWVAAVCVFNQGEDANQADALRMLRAVSAPVAAPMLTARRSPVMARRTRAFRSRSGS